MTKKKIMCAAGISALVLLGIAICLFFVYIPIRAEDLVDTTVNADFLYSKYALGNYQLDFYVSTKGGWLPWNWGDSIGKGVMYGLYLITDGIWSINTKISSLVGSAVSECFKLDFVSSAIEMLGKNLQTISGVSSHGFSWQGLYVRFAPWFVLLTGLYIVISAMKRETSKAVGVTVNMVLVFLLSAGLIAFAPKYLKSVNEFSIDTSSAMLDVGAKVLLPGSNVSGADSSDLIRENLFAIQVYKPWLLLQFGTSDVDTIGQERIDSVLAVSPSTGELREEAVKKEVEDNKNMNMSLPEVAGRLGSVLLLLIINIIISIFVLLLVCTMLMSQLFFIAFAMFLPLSFLVSMIPGQGGKWKQAVLKLFNILLMRTGISFIITVTFCLSSMVYTVTTDMPFLLIGILQIMVFVGMYMKMNELLSVMNIGENGERGMGSRMFRRPMMYARRGMNRVIRSVTSGAVGGFVAGKVFKGTKRAEAGAVKGVAKTENKQRNHSYNEPGNIGGTKTFEEKPKESMGTKLGRTAGKMKDTPAHMADNIKKPFEKVKDMPVNASYGLHNLKEDFTKGVDSEISKRKDGRADRQELRRETQNQKKQEMQSVRENKQRSGLHKLYDEKFTADKTADKSQAMDKINDVGKMSAGTKLNGQVVKQSVQKPIGQPIGKSTEQKTAETNQPTEKPIERTVQKRKYNETVRHELNNNVPTGKPTGKPTGQPTEQKTVKTNQPTRKSTERALQRKKHNKWNDLGEMPQGTKINGKQG